ncbi:MAG TPA: hypothetical protein VIM11_18530 [Tepidisphaeraceae bacterium]|jgi:hypothetical protein
MELLTGQAAIDARKQRGMEIAACCPITRKGGQIERLTRREVIDKTAHVVECSVKCAGIPARFFGWFHFGKTSEGGGGSRHH